MALTRKQIGARLREIREEIGFTQAEIARRLGVHRPTISEIEAGRRAVTSEELFRFSEFYARPLSDLLSDPQPDPNSVLQVMFRARGDKQGPDARMAVQRFMERCRAERELETLLGLPRPAEARPAYRVAEPQSKGDAIRQGESIATQERRRLDLGAQPVRGILDLLERQGVSIGPLLADPNAKSDLGIDGVYFETGSLGACIAVNLNDGESASFRDVFTAAHEYAHWLLRDRQIELFSFEAGTTDLLEVRANAFAASFLLPRDGLRDYFQRTGVLRGEMLSHVSPGDIVRAMGCRSTRRTSTRKSGCCCPRRWLPSSASGWCRGPTGPDGFPRPRCWSTPRRSPKVCGCSRLGVHSRRRDRRGSGGQEEGPGAAPGRLDGQTDAHQMPPRYRTGTPPRLASKARSRSCGPPPNIERSPKAHEKDGKNGEGKNRSRMGPL